VETFPGARARSVFTGHIPMIIAALAALLAGWSCMNIVS
jgi:hypothetical protein